MNSIIPGTIEEPGLDTRKVGTLVARRGATGIEFVDFSDWVVQVAREINTEAGRPVAIAYRVANSGPMPGEQPSVAADRGCAR